MQDKKILRSKLLADRRAIPDGSRRLWDQAIAQRLLPWIEQFGTATLGVYWPLPGEPDLSGLYRQAAAAGTILALPKVLEKDSPLVFLNWKPGDPLAKDASGVPAPLDTPAAAPHAILVPCVGYNSARVRLGYGAGYYDRTLARAPRPLAVGVAYSCTHAEFEAAAHDLPLDAIVTECSTVPDSFWETMRQSG